MFPRSSDHRTRLPPAALVQPACVTPCALGYSDSAACSLWWDLVPTNFQQKSLEFVCTFMLSQDICYMPTYTEILWVSVYAFMCAHVYMNVCTYTCLEIRGQHRISPSFAVHLILWSQGL